MDRGELEGLDRESLVVRAQAAGIRRARILTRPELIDELLRTDPSADESQLKKSRGFFGRARDLVARVVERGLHLPDAADRIRTLAGNKNLTLTVPRTEPQAMPTVTLAEIYAAQGHSQRAIETLRRVLEREPEHAAARALLERLSDAAYVGPEPPLPPEPEVEARVGFLADDEPVAAALDDVEDDESDAFTIDTSARDGAVPAPLPLGIEGPTYDGSNGEAEFHLAPESDRQMTREEIYDDPAYGPTRELPRGIGRTYAFAAPRASTDVDVHGRTDKFHVVPPREEETTVAIKGNDAIVDPPASEPEGPGARSAEGGELLGAGGKEDIDECFAIPLSRDSGDEGAGARMYVRWNISSTALGALLGAQPRGRFVVRAYVVTPGWDGPNTETRDLAVDPNDGETTLQALPEPAVVRVAVGWLDAGASGSRPTFVPLAHSPAFETTPAQALMIWTPRGLAPVAKNDPRAASIARALDASKRAAAH
jgi:hypothetical protein